MIIKVTNFNFSHPETCAKNQTSKFIKLLRVSLESVLCGVSMVGLSSELIVESVLGVSADSLLEYSNSVV